MNGPISSSAPRTTPTAPTPTSTPSPYARSWLAPLTPTFSTRYR